MINDKPQIQRSSKEELTRLYYEGQRLNDKIRHFEKLHTSAKMAACAGLFLLAGAFFGNGPAITAGSIFMIGGAAFMSQFRSDRISAKSDSDKIRMKLIMGYDLELPPFDSSGEKYLYIRRNGRMTTDPFYFERDESYLA